MLERRNTHRDRTYLGGRISFNHRRSTLDCLVRNLSQDGAMIVLSDAVAAPADFDIMIRHKGDSRRARIVWRDRDHIGIQFLQSARDDVVSIEAARLINTLEADRAALKRRIAQLKDPV